MEDIFLVTMLNSTIDEVKTQCLSNKAAFNHCSHKDFWIEKFNHDNLPLFNHPSSIGEWIKLYKLMQKYKYDVQDLLLINKIESERVIDPLNQIKLPISNSIYHLFKDIYKDDFDINSFYDIIINQRDNEVSYTRIELDTGELFEVKQSMHYNKILILIISILYLDPHIEILDQMSNLFMIGEDNISGWDIDSQRIAYKRLGIISAINYI